eukprot:7005826-Prymnesium_polylepis.1
MAKEKLGEDAKPFKFISRAKHSAYKECHICQSLRLDVSAASKRGAPPDEIHRLKGLYADHLQWMIKQ